MKNLTRSEKIFLAVLALTLFIGIWHALPEITIVRDESLYVGDVLRAIQAATLIPHIGASYILSFFASYLLMLPTLAGIFLIQHASVSSTIDFLHRHYYALYLVPRTVSVLASLGIAYMLLQMARIAGRSSRERILAVVLIFSTTIIATIMHTGKMWALTTFLVVLADYCYVLALENREQLANYRWYASPLFWCVGAAALATTNFPVAGVAFVAPTLLFWQLREKVLRRKLFAFGALWILVGAGLTLLNIHGWTIQNDSTQSDGLFAPIQTTLFQLSVIISLAPLILIGILGHIDRIKNKGLFFLALGQAGLFILILSFRAPWLLIITEVWRYFFLVIMLLGIALLATSLHRHTLLYFLCAVSSIFFLKTIYLLAVPTTYNNTYDWVAATIAKEPTVVRNDVQHLDLPLNTSSYALFRKEFCVSRCEEELAHPVDPAVYTLIQIGVDDPEKVKALAPTQYYLSSRVSSSTRDVLVQTFGTNPSSSDYYAINYRMGLYTLQFLTLPQLGENIYVYRIGKK